MSQLSKGRQREDTNPITYGLKLTRKEFTAIFANHLQEFYKGSMTIDELVLHPREALAFCDHVRKSEGYYEVPDHAILRLLMNRRKTSPAYRSASTARYYLPGVKPGPRCEDCTMPYSSPGWIEAVLPTEHWLQVTDGKPELILCINCIGKRCVDRGMIDVPVTLTAGPLVLKPPTPFIGPHLDAEAVCGQLQDSTL